MILFRSFTPGSTLFVWMPAGLTAIPGHQRLALLATLALLFFGAGAPSNAADVTWQTPQAVSSDADVFTLGTYVGTIVPPAAANKVVNGVTFGNDANATYNGWGLSYGMESANSGLSADYKAILDSGNPEPTSMTINGLTVGRSYLVQFWVGDWRGYITSDRQQTITGGTGVSGVMHWGDADNNEGGVRASHVIGTFTADATSQVFTFSPYNAQGTQFNAMQLRDLSAAFVWNNASRSNNWNTSDTNWTGRAWTNGSGNTASFVAVGGTINLSTIVASDVAFGSGSANIPDALAEVERGGLEGGSGGGHGLLVFSVQFSGG